MEYSTITILKDTLFKPERSSHSTVITFDELKALTRQGALFKHLLHYKEARLLTYRLDVIPKPFLAALLLRLLSTKSCYFEDEQGNRLAISTGTLASLFSQALCGYVRKASVIDRIRREVEVLAGEEQTQRPRVPLDLSATPVYLRTDLCFGVRSGGSIGHIAGVLNNIDSFTAKPVFITTDTIPTVREDIETHVISPSKEFWDFRELPSLLFTTTLEANAIRLLSNRNLSFIYQRYSLNNYSGLKLARHFNVPLVLEYNGSETWMNRHWGRPLKYEALSEKIELLNLTRADLIVVVSEAMRGELLTRGIDDTKVLVNPNGVNAQRYSPEVDGSSIRKKYGLDGMTVIGFIGTFGKWHGAEVLAEAFGLFIQQFPDYRSQIRLLMIGDGELMPQVKERLARFNVTDEVILTGLVPQVEGPSHLAACDILVSPHVPNPDGSPFFGSPTKLFEYMAMGKAILASDLDQIGQILKHEQTAWMVRPGDASALMDGLKVLVDDKELRDRLGATARNDVVANYTWSEHTRKIVEKLKGCCG